MELRCLCLVHAIEGVSREPLGHRAEKACLPLDIFFLPSLFKPTHWLYKDRYIYILTVSAVALEKQKQTKSSERFVCTMQKEVKEASSIDMGPPTVIYYPQRCLG